MAKLLMITGLGSAMDLASGRRGAFYNTLEEFRKHWDRIDIISPKVSEPKNKPFDNVYIHISPWPLVFHPFWFLKKGLEIYQDQKFDLMTVQDFPPFYNGIGARFLWQRIGVPYVLEFHHIPGYPKAAEVRERLYSQLWLWKLYWHLFGSRAKAVRVVNQKQTPEFLKKASLPENKINYIPSIYIDLDIFRPMGLQKEYDLIFVGRLEANKGIEMMLKAIKLLAISYQVPIKCLIVGDGSMRKFLELEIRNWKLENNILCYSWVKNSEEIAKLINQAKILIMPSYNEGGPRVVLEAMACGVPVLATNVGLMPDFADKNAVKIIDWNAKDIASKAKEVLENEDEGERLAIAGMEIARQFEKKAMIKNYADKLKEFIQR